jgi:hypothetical protein
MRTSIVAVVLLSSAIAAAKPPPGEIRIASQRALDDTSLSVTSVVTKINGSYMAGIKKCYQKQLAKKADAAGDLSLAFAVGPNGKAVHPSASGVDGVDNCVTRAMMGWAFTAPKDKEKKAATAHFELELKLSPGAS